MKAWNTGKKEELKELASEIEFRFREVKQEMTKSKPIDFLDKKAKLLAIMLRKIQSKEELKKMTTYVFSQLMDVYEEIINLVRESYVPIEHLEKINIKHEKETANLLMNVHELEDILKDKNEEIKVFQNKMNRLEEENKKLLDKMVNKVRKISAKQEKLNDKIELKGKKLSKKNALEIIEEILKSKKAFNKKMSSTKQPLETMEQYLYTFLNQKFGIKVIL